MEETTGWETLVSLKVMVRVKVTLEAHQYCVSLSSLSYPSFLGSIRLIRQHSKLIHHERDNMLFQCVRASSRGEECAHALRWPAALVCPASIFYPHICFCHKGVERDLKVPGGSTLSSSGALRRSRLTYVVLRKRPPLPDLLA